MADAPLTAVEAEAAQIAARFGSDFRVWTADDGRTRIATRAGHPPDRRAGMTYIADSWLDLLCQLTAEAERVSG